MQVQRLSKAKLKQYSGLSLKKYRYRQRQLLIEGEKMVGEALEAGWDIEAVILAEARAEEAERFAPHPVYLADTASFKQLTQQVTPAGVLAILPFPEAAPWELPSEEPLPPGPGFILEDIQDPGNLGTLIRTADWLGFRAVVCSKGSVDVLNPKVLRSTMGSFFRVPVYYRPNLAHDLNVLAPHCWAADLEGLPLPEVPFTPKDYVVVGNEARGLSEELRQLPTLRRLSIPGRGGAESLNAAIAGAMVGWQLFCSQLHH